MMTEKMLAFFIALILVTGKLLLERQRSKDREEGMDIDPAEYRYGRIMGRYLKGMVGGYRKKDGNISK